MQIIKIGAKHFIEDGYTKATMKRISRELDLSPGNITFYFPTKDHLLAVLINELFDFQNKVMEKAVADRKDPILEYCMSFAVIAAMCAEDGIAKDLYTSAYTAPYTLDLIRRNGTKKAKAAFGNFCKNFSEEDWSATGALISGIEYGAITSLKPHAVTEKALHSIMTLYGVPEDLRTQTVNCVLSFDHSSIGKRILRDFLDHVDKTNEIADI